LSLNIHSKNFFTTPEILTSIIENNIPDLCESLTIKTSCKIAGLQSKKAFFQYLKPYPEWVPVLKANAKVENFIATTKYFIAFLSPVSRPTKGMAKLG
jgi:hypothetical protein